MVALFITIDLSTCDLQCMLSCLNRKGKKKNRRDHIIMNWGAIYRIPPEGLADNMPEIFGHLSVFFVNLNLYW